LFDDGNKRTAQAVAEKILGESANPSVLRNAIDRVGSGEIKRFDEIVEAISR
jgi:hypothetical protein